MTPEAALVDLLERLGNSRSAAVLIDEIELKRWPVLAVKAIKSQKLIVKTRPSRSAACPGCEQKCVMPAQTLPAMTGSPISFIVCDKRNDVNRVPISPEQLSQWQCHADSVCKFVATSLGLRRSSKQKGNNGLWEIGIATGNKRRQMLCLQINTGLNLVAGNNTVPLIEFIEFNDGRYSLDSGMISQLVDAAGTADERYTPNDIKRESRKLKTQTMYAVWRKEYLVLKKKRPGMSDKWYARNIAKMDIANGRSPETIRKNMKK